MLGCGNCSRMTGIVLLVFGLAFLLVDFGVWDFWGISWYTVAFIVFGVVSILMTTCDDCMLIRGQPVKKK
jgi:hypothetical protein